MLLVLPQPVPTPGSVTSMTGIPTSMAILSVCSHQYSNFTAYQGVIYEAA